MNAETLERPALCAQCALNPWCRPSPGESPRKLRVAKGELLYRARDPLQALYAVHAGFFKLRACTVVAEHVTGFQMAGELLGVDGLGSGRHASDAVALEDSVVCVVPMGALHKKTLSTYALQHDFHTLLGQELDRRQQLVAMLAGGYSADMRVAAFLDDLAHRLKRVGFSGSSIHLRMTRRDIGLYLGVTLETVSRCLGKLHDTGVLRVSYRAVEILDPDELLRIATEPQD